MSRAAIQRAGRAGPATPAPTRRRRRPSLALEAERMGELAAAFSLFGLDINVDQAKTDSAAAYRAGAPAHAAANDADPAPSLAAAVPLGRNMPRLPARLPVRLMQGLDWIVAIATAQVATLWGAGARLSDLAIGDAAAFIMSAAALKLGLWLTGAYQVSPARMRATQGAGGLALGAVLGLGLAATLAPDARSVAALAAAIPAAAMSLAALHAVLAIATAAALRAGAFSDSIVIVGATASARRYAVDVTQSGEARIAAIFDDRRSRARGQVFDMPVSGSVADLLAWQDLPYVDRVVIAVPTSPARLRAIAERLKVIPNQVDTLVDDPHVSTPATRTLFGKPRNHAYACVKRLLDLVLGAALIGLFALPMLMIALFVRVESRGPAIVRAVACGRNNRAFVLRKFRTRRADTQKPTVTRLGGFLARTRLDDLPQLFSVLGGDMSLIGPRPHLAETRRLTADYAHRHRVKPGLIGWAHVNGVHGRAHTPAAARKRHRLDLEYANRASILLDLHIILRAAGDALGAGRQP